MWQLFEHIIEIGLWIDSVIFAVLDDGIDDSGTLPCGGVADEEPVFRFMQRFA